MSLFPQNEVVAKYIGPTDSSLTKITTYNKAADGLALSIYIIRLNALDSMVEGQSTNTLRANVTGTNAGNIKQGGRIITVTNDIYEVENDPRYSIQFDSYRVFLKEVEDV